MFLVVELEELLKVMILIVFGPEIVIVEPHGLGGISLLTNQFVNPGIVSLVSVNDSVVLLIPQLILIVPPEPIEVKADPLNPKVDGPLGPVRPKVNENPLTAALAPGRAFSKNFKGPDILFKRRD